MVHFQYTHDMNSNKEKRGRQAMKNSNAVWGNQDFFFFNSKRPYSDGFSNADRPDCWDKVKTSWKGHTAGKGGLSLQIYSQGQVMCTNKHMNRTAGTHAQARAHLNTNTHRHSAPQANAEWQKIADRGIVTGHWRMHEGRGQIFSCCEGCSVHTPTHTDAHM